MLFFTTVSLPLIKEIIYPFVSNHFFFHMACRFCILLKLVIFIPVNAISSARNEARRFILEWVERGRTRGGGDAQRHPQWPTDKRLFEIGRQRRQTVHAPRRTHRRRASRPGRRRALRQRRRIIHLLRTKNRRKWLTTTISLFVSRDNEESFRR